jgi:hypothetical protein
MAYEIQNKKIWFYTFFEFKVAGEVLIAFETEFRRERVMRFLTVSLDKHAISWAERRRTKLKSTKLNYHGNITTIQEKKTEISDILRLEHRNKQTKKYCRFKKSGIKYIDYKDADFLLKFVSKENSSSF